MARWLLRVVRNGALYTVQSSPPSNQRLNGDRSRHRNPRGYTLKLGSGCRMIRIKILAWDGTGLCLFHKRLENGRFVWPPVQNGAIRLSAAQLGLLLEGLDWSRVRPRPVIAPLLAG